MKTPMKELINQVEQWMLDDKYVQDNPLDYEEYMVHYANQMIEVKGKFIDMCKSLLEKEIDMFEEIIDIIDSENSGLSAEQRLDEINKLIKTFNTK
jgi:hypothetical protein